MPQSCRRERRRQSASASWAECRGAVAGKCSGGKKAAFPPGSVAGVLGNSGKLSALGSKVWSVTRGDDNRRHPKCKRPRRGAERRHLRLGSAEAPALQKNERFVRATEKQQAWGGESAPLSVEPEMP